MDGIDHQAQYSKRIVYLPESKFKDKTPEGMEQWGRARLSPFRVCQIDGSEDAESMMTICLLWRAWLFKRIVRLIVNPRPDGAFPNPARRWGGGVREHSRRAICQTSGPMLVSKTAFDSPCHKLTENIAKFYLKVTDVVTD